MTTIKSTESTAAVPPAQIPEEKFIANYELNDYSYDAFWNGRDYEHEAEIMLLKKIMGKYIQNPERKNIVDLGGAYGRLAPLYKDTFKQFIIADYSTRELSKAKIDLKNYENKMTLVGLNVYKLPFPDQSVDTILCNRLIHHIANPDIMFGEIERVLKPGGILILEVAHKRHIMSFFKSLFGGTLSEFYSNEPRRIDHNPIDSQGISEGQVSIIYSFPTGYISKLAEEHDLNVLEKRACSFLRSTTLKKLVPIRLLLSVESVFQSLFAHIYITPSVVFIMQKAQKSQSEVKNETNGIDASTPSHFQCPACQSELREEGGVFRCTNCGKSFNKTAAGIYDFRDPRPEEVTF